MGKPGLTRSHYLICAFLIIAVVVIYWQALGFEFTHFDDQIYVTENPNIRSGVTPASVQWAFTHKYESNWIPLTWISLMLDYQISQALNPDMNGLDPAQYHLTNILLHIANGLLLFLVLSAFTGAMWRSAFVAALFAVHPLHVESVAWVAERKDVLSTLFWLLTMWAYLFYVRKPGLKRYLLMAVVFALGLMAKSMLVMLPVILLLLDYWPLGRLKLRGEGATSTKIKTLVLEKVPLLVMALACGITTIVVQKVTGAVQPLTVYTPGVRIANAFVSYIDYLVKTVCPKNLVFYYTHPDNTLPTWQVLGAAVLLIATTVAVVRYLRGSRYLLVGWSWYVISLLPVIGLIQVGGQAMADRYTYIPLIGIFIIVAWGVPDLIRLNKASKLQRAAVAVIACGVLVSLISAAHTQASYWKDDLALYGHGLHVDPDNAIAHYDVATTYAMKGSYHEAAQHYMEAIRVNPKMMAAHDNLGTCYYSEGRLAEAEAQWRRALKIIPSDPNVNSNLAAMLFQQGKVDDAIKHFRTAVKSQPKDDHYKKALRAALKAKREGSP